MNKSIITTISILVALGLFALPTHSSPGQTIIVQGNDDSVSYLPYLEWYHKMQANHSHVSLVSYVVALIFWLLFLFGFVGIVASDFFCPNLSTMSSKLGLSESVAGSTLLAFGNGSPDVFSTFAAMSAGSGSLAIGELLGAAAFIVSVVAGIMTLVKPFKVARHSFLRDVGFFTTAVALVLIILWDTQITQVEAALMVTLYVAYVFVVAVGSWWHGRRERIKEAIRTARLEYADEFADGADGQLDMALDLEQPYQDDPDPPLSPLTTAQQHTPLNDDAVMEWAEQSSPVMFARHPPSIHDTRHRSISISGRPGSVNRSGSHRRTLTKTSVRPSLLGAIEFRDVVNSLSQDSSARSLAVFGQGQRHYHAPGPPSPGGTATLTATPGPGHRVRAVSQHNIPVHVRAELDAMSTSQRPPAVRRAASLSGMEGMHTEQPPLEFFNVWNKDQTSPIKASGQSNLIDLSPVDDPWKAVSPKQSLYIDTSLPSTSDLTRSPLPITPDHHADDETSANAKTLRKVPSIVVVAESGDVTPAQVPSPPASPPLNGAMPTPKWMRHDTSKTGHRQKLKYMLRSCYAALFPSLNDFQRKSILGGITAVLSAPAIFVLVLTLPVVDEEEENVAFDLTDDVEKPCPCEDASTCEHNHGLGLDTEDDPQRDARVAHALHSPAALHHRPPNSEDYETPLDVDTLDETLLRASLHFREGGPDEGHDATEGLDTTVRSPPGSPIAAVEQDAMDLKISNALVILQCTLAPWFCFLVILAENARWWHYIAVAATSALGFLLASAMMSSPTRRGRFLLCFVGFAVSMVWLMTCVGEIVGVLQALGHVFGLSDAILGITVFALGNSTADLVANYTIASMGYPVMAISACYGGPLLNLLLGIGLSGTYFIAKEGQPYHVDFDATLISTCTCLLVILGATLVYIPYNNYQMSKRWGAFLILAYFTLTIVNLIVELKL